jgi:hypothetical protein
MNTPATRRAARAGSPPRTWAAVAAAAGFTAITGFEIALALGAPLGRAAWGGAHVHLTEGLRIASGFAAIIWILAALVILARAGFRRSPVPFRVSQWGAWALTGVLALGALMNFASPSPWERFLQAPIALAIAALCLVVARGGHPKQGPIS